LYDISFFCIGEEFTKLHTKDSKNTMYPRIGLLEVAIDPENSFVPSTVLVAHGSIKHMSITNDRKLLVKLDYTHVEPIIVSKAKASEFF